MHAEPAEADAPCDQREDDEDVGPEGAEVGVGAEDEEDDDLDGEADAVAEEDDAVDRAVCPGEAEDGVIFATDDDGALVDEVLRGGGREVEEREAVVADVVGV